MSAKSLLVFMLMTLVLVVAAVVAVGSRPVSVSIPTDRALVFPDVAPGLNLVTEVEIRTPERTYTIARKGDKWGVKEINDYPVRFEKVKTALVGKPGRITTALLPQTARQIGLPGFRATPWARMPGGGNRLTTW